jgi:hypothetical protein
MTTFVMKSILTISFILIAVGIVAIGETKQQVNLKELLNKINSAMIEHKDTFSLFGYNILSKKSEPVVIFEKTDGDSFVEDEDSDVESFSILSEDLEKGWTLLREIIGNLDLYKVVPGLAALLGAFQLRKNYNGNKETTTEVQDGNKSQVILEASFHDKLQDISQHLHALDNSIDLIAEGLTRVINQVTVNESGSSNISSGSPSP